mgnify:CR=1
MNWTGKKVLVTGAGGFIGSHLAERLVEMGADVRAMVHYNALGSWGWLDESPLAEHMQVFPGDVRDRDSVRAAVEGREIVFHLAALIAIPYSYTAPSSYVDTNITGTIHVLQAVRELGSARVVHTSTSETYGTARYSPIDERHPLHGQSPYAASKIGADQMAEAFYCSFGVPVAMIRPFNTFGPRQSVRAVIPTIISQLLAGEELRLGNLTPTRDLNFVANTVDGFLRAAAVDEAIGQVINVGSGREISIGDLAQLIANLMGVECRIHEDAQRVRPEKSEVGRLIADNKLAKSVLGWEPRVSLEDGLLSTISWIKARSAKYRADVYVL